MPLFISEGENLYGNDLKCTSSLEKRLSKSTSELSCHDHGALHVADNNNETKSSDSSTRQRVKNVVNPSVSGVLQKTHGFFSSLKVSAYEDID